MEVESADNNHSFGGLGAFDVCNASWKGRHVEHVNQDDRLEKISFGIESPVFAKALFYEVTGSRSLPSTYDISPPAMPVFVMPDIPLTPSTFSIPSPSPMSLHTFSRSSISALPERPYVPPTLI